MSDLDRDMMFSVEGIFVPLSQLWIVCLDTPIESARDEIDIPLASRASVSLSGIKDGVSLILTLDYLEVYLYYPT